MIKLVGKCNLLLVAVISMLIASCAADNNSISYNYYKLTSDEDSSAQKYIIEKVFNEGTDRLVLWNLCDRDTINFKCKVHLKVVSDTLFRIAPNEDPEPFFIKNSECKTRSFFLPIESTSKFLGEIDTVYAGKQTKLYKFRFQEDVIDGQDLILYCDENYTFVKVIGHTFTAEKVNSLPSSLIAIQKNVILQN